VLRLAPPLSINPDEVDQLVGIVADSIHELQKECGG
jgi:4-aminobutyrate aminotransferase-like enzyme